MLSLLSEDWAKLPMLFPGMLSQPVLALHMYRTSLSALRWKQSDACCFICIAQKIFRMVSSGHTDGETPSCTCLRKLLICSD